MLRRPSCSVRCSHAGLLRGQKLDTINAPYPVQLDHLIGHDVISTLAVANLHFLPVISLNRGEFQKCNLRRAVHHRIALPDHAPKHLWRAKYLLNRRAGVGKGTFEIIRLKSGNLRTNCCFNLLALGPGRQCRRNPKSNR